MSRLGVLLGPKLQRRWLTAAGVHALALGCSIATSLDDYDRRASARPVDGGSGSGSGNVGGGGSSGATTGGTSGTTTGGDGSAGVAGSAGGGGTSGMGPGGTSGAGPGGSAGTGGSAGMSGTGGSAGTGGTGATAGTGGTGGSSGTGGCTQTQCGADCADVNSDPNHCGQCDHDCDGGTCSSGKCQPVLLSSGNGQEIYSVAVDATHVYFGSFGLPASIFRVPIGQPMATDTLYSKAHDAAYIVLTSSRVVWAGSNGLRSVPKGGGTETELDANAGRTMPATNGSDVYYVATRTDGIDVMKVPASGGTPTLVGQGSSASESGGLVLVGTDLYILIRGPLWFIVHFASGTSQSTTIVQGNPPRMPATDGTTLAIATTFSGIQTSSLPNISMAAIASGSHAAVAVHDGRVYYRDGSLRSVDPDGANEMIHATGVGGGPFGNSIAVDARNVYYADGDSVYKVRR